MQIKVVNSASAVSEAVVYLFRQNDDLVAQIASISNDPLLQKDFKADFKQVVTLYQNAQRVFLVGLGKAPKEVDFVKTLRSFFHKHKKLLPNHVTLSLTVGMIESDWLQAIANGITLGDYDIDLYKTDKIQEPNFFERGGTVEIVVAAEDPTAAQKAVSVGVTTGQTQIAIMDLMNAPANKKFPQTLANFAQKSAQRHGYTVKVFDEKMCEDIGLQALLAVAKGSEHPPRFIVLEYIHPAATQKIGLVGKGVTFDTGGISIKPSTNMHLMKSDMGGAAAVLGTVDLVAQLQLPVHLIGIVPTTENSVDGLATKPGDVIGSYSGKTIEVIDTDAEGRIILADGLSYLVRNYAPDTIVDLATLTGSCVATLGYAAAGMFTQNDALAQSLYESGQQTGEKLWRLPLWDDYKDELKSDVADVKNYHGKPIAGAIVAAKFLEVFTENHPAWVHLDIAGTAFADSEFASMKSATAYGVRLLTHWLEGRG
ncbi:MAG: leucyl aminopeptidase [Spirosomaceae bacterium]|jgi:leucyl aminopeptidase|nr:leucyl aminopeptidase [Spirosomataceae bacterium]